MTKSSEFVFDKQLIISKLGVTGSFGASPIFTSLSQSTADSQLKNFKLNSAFNVLCVSTQESESTSIFNVSNSTDEF